MNRTILRPALAAILGAAVSVGALGMAGRLHAGPAQDRAEEQPLGHMVFFTLAEPSPENAAKLSEACTEYLTGHEGTIHFSVGTRAEGLDRDVNDKDFDVALHLIFATRADHDRYQTAPRHLEFIEKNSDLWSQVRVFDSSLSEVRGRGRRRESR